MSKNIFNKSNFIKFSFFVFLFFISIFTISYAQNKAAGSACVFKSSGSECASGYACKTSNPGQAKDGDSGICTVVPTQGGASTPLPTFSDIGTLITNLNKNVVQNLVVLLGGAALVVFLWGMILFIYHRQNAKIDDKDKDMMLWGLIGLFVFVSVWGIIKMFQGFLGVEGTTIELPTICVSGSCNSRSGAGGGGIETGGGGAFDNTNKLNTVGTVDADSVKNWDLSNISASPNTYNKDVAELQTFLNKKNYKSNDGKALVVDGKYGTKTTEAVIAFQKDNKLEPDGKIGFSTRAVIVYRHLGGIPTRDIHNVQTWSTDMTTGSSGTHVTELQNFLVGNDCYLSTATNKTPDGQFGTDTFDAVKKYQQKNFLKQDGIVGPSTRAVILGENTVGC